MKKYVKSSEEDIRHQLKDAGVINPEDYKNEEDSEVYIFSYPYGQISVVMDSAEIEDGIPNPDVDKLYRIVVPYLYNNRKELDCEVVYDTEDIASMMEEDGFNYFNDDDFEEWISQMFLWDDGNGEYLDDSYCGFDIVSIRDFLNKNY